MVNRTPLRVIKVPLDYVPEFKPINFPNMSRLYLELLENKLKVKPELRNKEYEPKGRSNRKSFENSPNQVERNQSIKKNTEELNKSSKKLEILDISNMTNEDINNLNKKREEKNVEVVKQDELNEEEDIGYDSSKSKKFETNDYTKKGESSIKLQNKEEFNSSNNDEEELVSENQEDKIDKNLLNILRGKEDRNENKEEVQKVNESQYKDTFYKVGLNRDESLKIDNSRNYDQKVNSSNEQRSSDPRANHPPSLSEISSGKVNDSEYREIKSETVGEDDIIKKRNLLYSFRFLKKRYKDANIPEFSEHTDLHTLQREYDNIVKNLRIDSTVETYKKFLTIGFYGLEFVLTTFLKFKEITGFTQEQMLNMNQYEEILIEIGEKSYVPDDKRLPAEIRLLGIIFMNAAVFIGSRMLFKSSAGNIMNMFNNTTSNSSSNNFSQQVPIQPNMMNQPKKVKPKMKGPDVDFEDFGKKNN